MFGFSSCCSTLKLLAPFVPLGKVFQAMHSGSRAKTLGQCHNITPPEVKEYLKNNVNGRADDCTALAGILACLSMGLI